MNLVGKELLGDALKIVPATGQPWGGIPSSQGILLLTPGEGLQCWVLKGMDDSLRYFCDWSHLVLATQSTSTGAA